VFHEALTGFSIGAGVGSRDQPASVDSTACKLAQFQVFSLARLQQ
jgi:hypothetical protein